MRKIPCLLILLPALAFADEVYLKGGARFSGKIVAQTETMVTIDIGDGVVGVTTSRIERIVKGSSPLDVYQERATKMGTQDVEGWRDLGRYASQQGLSAQARQAYQNVLGLAPDDPEARRALGYVQVNGQWLTEEESYRARGFVKYDGEWMSPAEVQLAQSTAAAEQAREDAENRARDADVARMQAEAEAGKKEERDRWEESTQSWNFPVYWGGWGYGVSAWPSTGSVTWRQPAMRPPAPSGVPK